MRKKELKEGDRGASEAPGFSFNGNKQATISVEM
jgi:hypothetical protein